MSANPKVQKAIVKLVPGGQHHLAHLSDAELLASTRRLMGTSNRLLAALLLHLAEVEARGIHRSRACASLYTYCIYELRMSEDAAARRSSAARLVKAFPPLLDAIAAGELHLTGLLMLGPHLTPENHLHVLARAKFRTKRELAKLVRELQPLPLVPDQVEPLGPEVPPALRAPTWEQWVSSLCPPVRELRLGERPADWANDTVPRVDEEHRQPVDESITAPARCELPPITAPQQYRMQFSTTEEHVRLVERAKALLARTSPGASLGELHQQAMQLLVDRLEKEKFALTEQPRGARKPPTPRQRSRHVPAAVRREVFARDAGCCSYMDERGTLCGETRYLELHHLQPFAQEGEHVAANLALRCAAHNALAAEEDFGRAYIEDKRHPARHDSLAA